MEQLKPPRMRTCMDCQTAYPDSQDACPSCGKEFYMRNESTPAPGGEPRWLDWVDIPMILGAGMLTTGLVFIALGKIWTGLAIVALAFLVGGVSAL